MTDVQKVLFELQDVKYRDFQSELIPGVDKNTVIGVRIPVLRKLANEMWKNGQGREFIKILPHRYYDENNLHAFFIEKITDFDEVVSELDRFLPFVDNWATCDSMNPKVFSKHPALTKKYAVELIASPHTYAVRYGIGLLMRHFLDDNFTSDILEIVSEIRSDEYYINMMIAWFFATALAKQYDSVLPYITAQKLDTWCHNKTIQKAVESYRITDDQKQFLKQYKKTPTH